MEYKDNTSMIQPGAIQPSAILPSAILHRPLGNEQPYYQKAYERFPRYPSAGEPVSIGFVVEPKPAESVFLLWTNDDWDTTHQVDALCIGNTDSVGHSGFEHAWVAMIPGTEAGKRVLYTLKAFTGQGIIESENFSYMPMQRITCDQIQFIDNIVLYTNEDSSCAVSWEFIPDGDKRIRQELTAELNYKNPSDKKNVGEKSLYTKKVIGNYELNFDNSDNGPNLILLENGVEVLKHCGPIEILATSDREVFQVNLAFEAGADEKFYGFGERYNKVNQRGQIIHSTVFEQYKNQQLKSYMPVPFFFTSEGRGFYTADDHRIIYDLCATDARFWKMQIEMHEEVGLVSYIYTGTPVEIISAYSKTSGLPVMPPEWIFGPWMSSNEWNTQDRVLAEARKTAGLDIPATVLVIEAWSDETTFYIWNGAEYRPKNPELPFSYSDLSFENSIYWDNPKAMSDELHELGMKLVLWQIPIIKRSSWPNAQHEADWQYAVDNSFCVKEADGTPYYVRPGWFQTGLLMDFSNHKAAEWWFKKRNYLVKECGVDGFKTDGGEHLWGEDTRFSNEKTGTEMLNAYPNSYIGAYHEYLKESKGQDGATFSRSGNRGAQKFPCHWTGDQGSSWESYRGVINAVLNAGLSGIPFIGWDIGGFSGDIPSSELYLRSAAAAAFSPVMQYHSEFHDHTEPHVDRTPWNIAERNNTPEVVDIYRMYAKLRCTMLPYLLQEAEYCCRTGEPMMRPLLLDNSEDLQACTIEDQYLFGRALLVAPILFEGAESRKVYLPAGEWIDVWTGEQLSGPVWTEREAGIELIPLYRSAAAEWPLDDQLFITAIADL
ncbi:MAG: hypothetical protein HQ557_10280 [Bacteroidetes bacterium]|nr:hypothetical protein [Bacteroidota bacterium]